MTARLRLLAALTRPAVVMLLMLFTATGLAQGGGATHPLALALAALVVAGFLLFSVACNDLADEAIDRVNLPGRPLAAGMLSRREFTVIGATAGVVALAASAALGWPAVLVTLAGLGLSAGYSLRPVRLADRGAVASLMLPACYVAVPYLLGVLASPDGVRALPRPGTLGLLGGLYLGFIGRILLKDFRDVRGDALFGKRTFLVRHGRGWTCGFSACCWVAGTAAILTSVHRLTPVLGVAEAVCTAGALMLLRALSRDRGPRRDEALIGAIAIVGRGMVLMLLSHLSMVSAGWGAPRYDAVLIAALLLTEGPAISMARNGPVTRCTIPDCLADATQERLAGRDPAPRVPAEAVLAETVPVEAGLAEPSPR